MQQLSSRRSEARLQSIEGKVEKMQSYASRKQGQYDTACGDHIRSMCSGDVCPDYQEYGEYINYDLLEDRQAKLRKQCLEQLNYEQSEQQIQVEEESIDDVIVAQNNNPSEECKEKEEESIAKLIEACKKTKKIRKGQKKTSSRLSKVDRNKEASLKEAIESPNQDAWAVPIFTTEHTKSQVIIEEGKVGFRRQEIDEAEKLFQSALYNSQKQWQALQRGRLEEENELNHNQTKKIVNTILLVKSQSCEVGLFQHAFEKLRGQSPLLQEFKKNPIIVTPRYLH